MPKKWHSYFRLSFLYAAARAAPLLFSECGGLVYPEPRRAAAFTYAKATPKKSAET
jgi:hypothetical protein